MRWVRRSPIAILLLCLHALLLAYSAWRHAPGIDEIGHLPAGLGIWQYGDFGLYRVNPPLVRAVATLPLALLDIETDYIYAVDTRDRPEFPMGTRFWQRHGLQAYAYLTLARITAIPFSLIAGGAIFCWSRNLYGQRAGLFSLALWCFSPLVLANASMITPDVGACAMGTLACLAFSGWLRERSWEQTVLAGILLGTAELTKFTWVLLFPLFVLQFVGWETLRRKTELRSSAQLVALFLVAVLVIDFGYGFAGSFQPLREYQFVSETLRGGSDEGARNRFAQSWLGHVLVPVPAEYLLGIDRQKLDFEGGFDSYLRGQWRDHGWWYYYLYGLATKTPCGYLAIFVLTAGTFVTKWFCKLEVFLLSPAIAILVLVSSQTGFSHHLRYVLPALPFVYVLAGRLMEASMNKRVKIAALVLLAGGILPSLYVFPHSHAYFNLAAGGPANGHAHLLDSNLDWGQDLLYLADWNRRHSEIELDGVAFHHGMLPLEPLGLPDVPPPPHEQGPQPGWWAVSVQRLHSRDGAYAYFRDYDPVATIGYTTYIYHLTDADVPKHPNDFAKEQSQ